MKKTLRACAITIAVGSILFAGCEGKKSDVLPVGTADSAALNQTSMTLTPGVLLVGMAVEYPPFESMDVDGSTPVGFDVELAKAIGAKLGLEVKLEDTSWDGIFNAVNTERLDAAVSAITITDARLAAHNFSRAYLANPVVIVTNKNSNLNVQSPMDTAGLDVGFQAQTTADIFMEDLRESEGLDFTARRYENVMYAFEDLRLERIGVIAVDLSVAGAYLGEEDSPFEVVWNSDNVEFFGIAMRPGNDELTAAIDKALQELFDDGTLVELSNRFLGVDMVTDAFLQ